MFSPQGYIEIAIAAKLRIQDAIFRGQAVNPRSVVIEVASQRLKAISKQTARGIKLGDLPSESPFPSLTEDKALVSTNLVAALKRRAGFEPRRKDEGGQKLTKEKLFVHDGALREEAPKAAPLIRGAMSETDAGSKATSAAGNSLGVGGRSTDHDRRNKQLHWGQDYDKTLSFIRDCL